MDDRDRVSIMPDKRRRKLFERWDNPAAKAKAEIAAMYLRQDEGLLEVLFIPILFLIMLVPLPLWPFIKHGEWDQDFWFSMKLTVLPIFFTVVIGSRLFMPHFWATTEGLGRGITILLLTAMLTFLSLVPVAVINRWIGESEPVVVSGTVLKKIKNEGTYGVRLQTSDGVLKLRVPHREYERAVVGGEFSKRYMRGSLGLLYRDD